MPIISLSVAPLHIWVRRTLRASKQCMLRMVVWEHFNEFVNVSNSAVWCQKCKHNFISLLAGVPIRSTSTKAFTTQLWIIRYLYNLFGSYLINKISAEQTHSFIAIARLPVAISSILVIELKSLLSFWKFLHDGALPHLAIRECVCSIIPHANRVQMKVI